MLTHLIAFWIGMVVMSVWVDWREWIKAWVKYFWDRLGSVEETI